MTRAHFIAVTTKKIGPTGPVMRIVAAGFDSADEALEVVLARLKPGETAKWLEQRSLSIRPGEVRGL